MNTRSCWLITLSILVVLAAFAGCSGDSDGKSSGPPLPRNDYDFEGDDDAAYDDTGADADDDAPNLFEPVNDTDVEAPGEDVVDTFARYEMDQSENFVYILNPQNDTVAKINSDSYEINSIVVGKNPTAIAACGTPECEFTNPVVLSQPDDDVPQLTVIDVISDETESYELRAGQNGILISPDGRVVVAYHDRVEAQSLSVADSNTITLVYPEEGRSVMKFVGFGISKATFALNSGRLVIAHQLGLHVIDPGASAAQLTDYFLLYSPDSTVQYEATELIVSPDGSRAYMMAEETDSVLVFNLGSGAGNSSFTAHSLGARPGQIGLTPDGETVVVAISGGPGGISTINKRRSSNWANDGEVAANAVWDRFAIAPDSNTVFAYTAEEDDTRADFIKLDTAEIIRTDMLRKPVTEAFITPDAESVLAFHRDKNNPTAADSYVGEYVATVISLQTYGVSNPVVLPGEPEKFSFSTDGRYGLITIPDNQIVTVVDFFTLIEDFVPLDSKPAYLGILPDSHTGFVSQEHRLGRISFIDAGTLDKVSITGFELNASIEY